MVLRGLAIATLLLTLGSSAALAAPPCRTSGTYEAWLAAFKREAAAKGISQRAIAEAAPSLTYDQHIVNIDRGQRVFAQTFLEFAGRMANSYRIQRGAALIKSHAAEFARIEQQYGVPAPVIVSFWALESDFGANMGKYHSLSAIASLAYDCRRSDRFRSQLFDALRLIDRGDLRPEEMIGSWAGELGQTQMMPSEYYQYAIDYDGDGKRDLIHNVARHARFNGKLSARARLAARRAVAHRSARTGEFAVGPGRSRHSAAAIKMGGMGRDARRRQAAAIDSLPASLLLPMGRIGPAFLAYQNFQVYLQWNNSLVYSTTAAYLATRIAGAPRAASGHAAARATFRRGQGNAGSPGTRRPRRG